MEKLHDAISSMYAALKYYFRWSKAALYANDKKNPEIKFVIRIVCKYTPDDLTHQMSLLYVVAIKYSNVKFN